MKKFAVITLVVLMLTALLVPAAFASDAEVVASPSKAPKISEVRYPTNFELPPTGSSAADFIIDHTNEGSWLIPKTYAMIFVTEQWAPGAEAKYVSEAPFAKFKAAYIDGTDVTAFATVTEGSTEVVIAEECMATLAIGAHTIVVESADGKATATFAVVEAAAGAEAGAAAGAETQTGEAGAAQSGEAAGAEQAAAAAADAAAAAAAAGAAAAASTPKTGDTSNTVLWAAISLVTLGAIGVVALPLVKKVKA